MLFSSPLLPRRPIHLATTMVAMAAIAAMYRPILHQRIRRLRTRRPPALLQGLPRKIDLCIFMDERRKSTVKLSLPDPSPDRREVSERRCSAARSPLFSLGRGLAKTEKNF